jgi:uncharacterized RDD family membrane protein YckC
MHHPIASVVNHVVEVVDIDGIVRRIDVNNVVERIDVNDIVERIDVNRMISRIDMNQVFSTIDWNQHLDKIDFDLILKKLDTKSIIARSSSGVFTTFLDTVRTQVVMIDLNLRIVARCRIWRTRHRQNVYLPPKPGRHRQREDQEVYPRGRTNKAVAVQGRYCGFVSKTIAILIDLLTVTFLFSFIFQVIQWFLVVFWKESKEEASNATANFQRNEFWVMVLYCLHWFTYFFLAVWLAGQTLGMTLVGLKVCNCNYSSAAYSTVTLEQALVRTLLLPVTLTLFPPLGAIGFVRRDGRMLHDLVAGTGIIYLWDAQLAKVRHQAMKMDQGQDASSSSGLMDDDAFDELDSLMMNNGEDDDHSDYHDAAGRRSGQNDGQEVLVGLENQVKNTIPTSSNQAACASTFNYATFPG